MASSGEVKGTEGSGAVGSVFSYLFLVRRIGSLLCQEISLYTYVFQSQWCAHRNISLEKWSFNLCIRFFKLFQRYRSVVAFSASEQLCLWRYKIHTYFCI